MGSVLLGNEHAADQEGQKANLEGQLEFHKIAASSPRADWLRFGFLCEFLKEEPRLKLLDVASLIDLLDEEGSMGAVRVPNLEINGMDSTVLVGSGVGQVRRIWCAGPTFLPCCERNREVVTHRSSISRECTPLCQLGQKVL